MAARATSAVVARWLGVAGDGRARQSFRPVRDERPEWLPAYRRSVRGGEGAVAVVGTVVAVHPSGPQWSPPARRRRCRAPVSRSGSPCGERGRRREGSTTSDASHQ